MILNNVCELHNDNWPNHVDPEAGQEPLPENEPFDLQQNERMQAAARDQAAADHLFGI